MSEGGGRSTGGGEDGGGGGGKGGSSSGKKRGRGRGGAASATAAVQAMEAIFNSSGEVSYVDSSGGGGSGGGDGGIRRVGRPSRGGPASSGRGRPSRTRGGPASRSRGGVKFKSKSAEPPSDSHPTVETISSGDEGDRDDEEVDDDAIDELLQRSNGVQKLNSTGSKWQRENQTASDDDDDDDDNQDDDSDDDYRISKLKPPSSTKFSSALKPKSLSYECLTCGRCFTLRHLLEFHLTKQHGLTMEKAKEGRHWKVGHICRDCDAQFQGEEDLEIHRQRMHGAVAGGGSGAKRGGASGSSKGGIVSAATTPQEKVVPRGKARRSRGGGGVFRGGGGSPSVMAHSRDDSLEYRLVPAPLPPPKSKMTPSRGNSASKWAAKITPNSLKRAARDEEEDEEQFSASDEDDDNSNDSDFVA